MPWTKDVDRKYVVTYMDTKKVSIIAGIVGIFIFALFYIYLPYTYVGAYAILLICIGSLILYSFEGTNWVIFILMCNILSSIYLQGKITPTMIIWILSIGIYLLVQYYIFKPNTIIIDKARKYSIKYLLPIIATGIGIILWYILAIWLLTTQIFSSKSKNTKISSNAPYQAPVAIDPTPKKIGNYTIILTKDQMDTIRPNRYRYHLQFSLQLMPFTGNNTEYSIITIDDNIDIRYNSNTGILSVWSIPMDQVSRFNLIYGTYYAPIQTWFDCVVNVSDGKLDFFVNSQLKLSANIIPNPQDSPVALTIGDKVNSVFKGTIKNIQVNDGIYVP